MLRGKSTSPLALSHPMKERETLLQRLKIAEPLTVHVYSPVFSAFPAAEPKPARPYVSTLINHFPL